MFWLCYVIPFTALIVGLGIGYWIGRNAEHARLQKTLKEKYLSKEK